MMRSRMVVGFVGSVDTVRRVLLVLAVSLDRCALQYGKLVLGARAVGLCSHCLEPRNLL